MAPGDWPSCGGNQKRRTQIVTALESLKSTDYWDDRSPDGLVQWKDLLQMAVRDGLARQVTSHTYELGPEFWEAAEKAIRPERGDRGGRGAEGGVGFGGRGARGGSGIGSRGAERGGDIWGRGARGGSGIWDRGAEGGGRMGGRGVVSGLKGPTQIMTALESLKLTDYWDDRGPDGLAQWRDLLQMAVRDGLARQVTSYTYELGPEFWEAAEKEIRPEGRS